MEFILGLIILVIVFLIALIPTWLLMLAYNYIAVLVGAPNWEIPVTFLSVVCVAFILSMVSWVFKRK